MAPRGTFAALKGRVAGGVKVIDWSAFWTASWKACVPLSSGALPLAAVMVIE